MTVLAATTGETALLFIELGSVVVGMALLARLASRTGFSPIPLYLIAGLAFGEGGLAPLRLTEQFVQLGAELGVVLLLFMLGLEYTAEELTASLRSGLHGGLLDAALNFTPGLAAGLLLGWDLLPALLLGGVTYVTSSGIVAKSLADLDRYGNRETPIVLSVLVFEDLAMTIYLPIVAALLLGGGTTLGLISVGVAITATLIALAISLRFGEPVSRLIHNPSDEVVLLTTFGLVLLVAGVAQQLQVSSAIGAFLTGIALSGEVAERARRLLGPLRDLFAAVFFLFFGLQIDPATLPPVLGLALGLGIVTAATKLVTGWWAARRAGIGPRGQWRAGAALIPRGEFSIVIAELGEGVTPLLGPLSAAYVLVMAIAGPTAMRVVDPLVMRFERHEDPGAREAVPDRPSQPVN